MVGAARIEPARLAALGGPDPAAVLRRGAVPPGPPVVAGSIQPQLWRQRMRASEIVSELLVGAAGIEPATTCSQSRYATAALRPVGVNYRTGSCAWGCM